MLVHSKLNIEKLLYRILLGYYYIYIDSERYKVFYPSLSIKYESEILYEQIIEDNKFEKIYMDQQEIKKYLLIHNIWSKTDDEKLKDCEKFIEDTKIDLYLNFYNENKKQQNKKNLMKAQKDLDILYNKKNSFNYLTIEDYATSIKNEFILMNTIYNSSNNLLFDSNNYDTLDYNRLQIFIREILEQTVKPDDLRLLAKSDIWKSLSVASSMKQDILTINDDHRHLLNLHMMYENVKQHPECPNNDIIDDDDALDGWFIYQNNKAEKDKKKNSVLEKVGDGIKNAGEVFLMTSDIDERNTIYDLNELSDRQNIKELITISKNNKDKNINWQDLPFVQRELKQQVNKQNSGSRKTK